MLSHYIALVVGTMLGIANFCQDCGAKVDHRGATDRGVKNEL